MANLVGSLMPYLTNKRTGILAFIPLIAFAATFLPYLFGFGHGKDLFGFAHDVPLAGVGLFLFLAGFKYLREKRLIEDTPTSKVRSVAMGLCEVAGIAREKSPLKSPFTSTDCVYCRFRVERESRNRKGGSSWITEREGCTSAFFYVEDETGKLLIDPLDCEGMLVQDYQEIKGKSGILSFATRYRYTEWYIRPGDYVYVLGTVRKFTDAAAVRKEKLRDKLAALKADREKFMQFDTDKDGQISIDEWDRAREQLEQEVFREEVAAKTNEDDIVIARGAAGGEETFIIADRDEREIGKAIGWRSFFFTGGGGVLVAAMCASFLARIGLLPHFLAIPWRSFYH